jgi:uncharacterized protein YprB with RNaseH-like and TPR domain
MELRDRLRALRNTVSSLPKTEYVRAAPLPYLNPLQNSYGQTYYNDKIYIEHHGEIDLKNFPELSAESLRFLSLDNSITNFVLRSTIFLDIETTGTAGGTGTYAFLVGIGFVEEGYFQIRQFFLHDLAEESAFLHAIADYSRPYQFLVTYNGKCFDTQILCSRYKMHHWEDPLAAKQHVDMLFIARRLWKRKHLECDLMNLERKVLNFQRLNDIPSFLIPSAYTDYLRFANSSLIQQVIHHNQWDILSLAVLTARACLLHVNYDSLSAEEHYSLSILYERQKNFRQAIEHQFRSLQTKSSLRHLILYSLAKNLRRVKDEEKLKWLLQQVPEEMDANLCRQLCIICEHDLKDPELALRLVQTQLGRMEKFRGISKSFKQNAEDWIHRKNRLLMKLSRIPQSRLLETVRERL